MSQTFALVCLVATVIAFSDWLAQTRVGRRIEPWLHRALIYGSASWMPKEQARPGPDGSRTPEPSHRSWTGTRDGGR